jgi:hypothetical protein
VVGEERSLRLRLAARQTVGGRRDRAEGHLALLVGRPGRRDRVAGRPGRVVGRRVRAAVHRGRRIGAEGHPVLLVDRRGRGMGRRVRVVVHSARAGRVVARMERVFEPPDAVRESGLGVVLSRANGR